jgi:pimeloyl-ACP methyl ester carboxylesterase
MGGVNDTGIPAPVPLIGVAAGVPYIALGPVRGRWPAPLVVAWHQLDFPPTGRAVAAALPLARLAAWRVYLGLPMTGAGPLADGPKDRARLAAEDFASESARPMVEHAFAEFPAAVTALRGQLPLDDGPIGLLGVGVGATVALLVLAEGEEPVRAAALVSPAVHLQQTAAFSQQRGNPGGRRAKAAPAAAGRLDFVARAAEIARRDPQPAVLLVTTAGDDVGVSEPAERVWHALAGRYRAPGRVALVIVPAQAANSLAGAPGGGPAPQTPCPARADAVVTNWLSRHLTDAKP